jgi:hypothetical protein
LQTINPDIAANHLVDRVGPFASRHSFPPNNENITGGHVTLEYPWQILGTGLLVQTVSSLGVTGGIRLASLTYHHSMFAG